MVPSSIEERTEVFDSDDNTCVCVNVRYQYSSGCSHPLAWLKNHIYELLYLLFLSSTTCPICIESNQFLPYSSPLTRNLRIQVQRTIFSSYPLFIFSVVLTSLAIGASDTAIEQQSQNLNAAYNCLFPLILSIRYRGNYLSFSF